MSNYNQISFSTPIDLSIPLRRQPMLNPSAFYLENIQYQTVEAGGFIGDTQRGGSCNCETITFNPHGNGTHTECAGHISREPIYISDVLDGTMFRSLLIDIPLPADFVGAYAITADDVRTALSPYLDHDMHIEALVIRTLPNAETKTMQHYSGESPAYFSVESALWMVHNLPRLKHLLTDLPSLDKEDDTILATHKIFFCEKPDSNEEWDRSKTVTEMIYAPESVAQGWYLLNLQIAAFESDASPSRPILYPYKDQA